MVTSPNPEQAAESARALLAERVELVRKVAAAAAEHERAKEAAEEAERDFAAAYKAATAGGWSENELRHVGISAPRRRTPGRPRKSRANGAGSTAREAGEATQE